MALVRMGVCVVPACRFPASAQIVVIGLVELAGIGHCRVFAVAAKFPFRMREVVAEDAGRLLVQGRVMEQEAVLAQGKILQPRPQFGFVEYDTAICPDQAKTKDVAGEIAQRSVVAHQFHRQQFALHVLQVE